MLETKLLPREFKVEIDGEDVVLPDPSHTMSVKAVIEHYANLYPELTNCKVDEPKIEKDKMVYNVSSKKGTHG